MHQAGTTNFTTATGLPLLCTAPARSFAMLNNSAQLQRQPKWQSANLSTLLLTRRDCRSTVGGRQSRSVESADLLERCRGQTTGRKRAGLLTARLLELPRARSTNSCKIPGLETVSPTVVRPYLIRECQMSNICRSSHTATKASEVKLHTYLAAHLQKTTCASLQIASTSA